MDAKEKGIMGALADPEVDIYTIPEFQRPFTWQSDQIEQLWDDLYENFTDNLDGLSDNGDNSIDNYFLGPLVFVRNKMRKSYDIIDGQQRTTTLHILLWILYHNIENEESKNRLESILLTYGKETKLKVSLDDASTMLAVRENKFDLNGNSNMIKCVQLLRKKVEILTNLKIDLFWNYLKDNIVFVVIVTDDYASAWELFIGLNGKGEPLNPADLIKAHVCGNSEVGEDASKIWQSSILPLKTDATFCLLMITRYRLNKFITENKLFKEFSKNFPSVIKTIDLATFSSVFEQFWVTPIDTIIKELSINTNAQKYLRIIRLLGRRDHTPLLFKITESLGKKYIFDENILKQIAIFQLRMAVSRKRSRERKIMSEFKTVEFNDIDNTVNKITEFFIKETPNDIDFDIFIKNLTYGSLPTKVILMTYEEGERGNKQIKDFQLEHLMPDTPTDFWYEAAKTKDINKYKAIVNNIGNLFLIDSQTNPSVGNTDFSIKKNAYQKHLKDWSISRVTKNITEWNDTDIENRAHEIAIWAAEKWSF